jgi:D-sedoheptulose 7-phosphate isomerase
MESKQRTTDATQLADIRSHIAASISVKQLLLQDTALLEQVERLSQLCLRCLQSGGKILFAGNGGSFADAQHLAAEFTGRFLFDRAPLPAIALGTNNSAVTAVGNDYGFEQVFARELRALARRGDVFIAITTSGNSPNILQAVGAALELGVTVVGLTGQSGGLLRQRCESICVPATQTARIQECHILLGHIVCELVEAAYFRESAAAGGVRR